MPGGVVAKNDLADDALVFGKMSFFDEMVAPVVFVLQDKSKLFLWPKNFATKKPSVLIQIPSNFLADFAILACGSGNGFAIGRVAFVNRARAIGVEDDADADLAVVFLREGGDAGGGEAEEKSEGEAAHDVCVGAGEGRRGSERRKGEATPSSIGGSSDPLSASRTDSSAGELDFDLGGAAFVCDRPRRRISVAVGSISLTPRFSEVDDRILPPTALAVLLVH
jgi:hypothetical protein